MPNPLHAELDRALTGAPSSIEAGRLAPRSRVFVVMSFHR